MIHAITWNRIGLGVAVLQAYGKAGDLLLSRLTNKTPPTTAGQETAAPEATVVDDLNTLMTVEHFCTAITIVMFGMKGTVGNHAMGTVILCSIPAAALEAWMTWKWRGGRKFVYLPT